MALAGLRLIEPEIEQLGETTTGVRGSKETATGVRRPREAVTAGVEGLASLSSSAF